jgi:hypothetical protein
MNKRAHKLYTLGRKFSAAGLCALAILILVVSCPLKRALQNNAALFTASSAQKSYRIAYQNTTSARFTKQLTCCAVQKKTISETVMLKVKQVLSPFYMVGDINHSTFEIAYLLSRIKQEPGFTIVFNTAYLPLFLQHRRLLI